MVNIREFFELAKRDSDWIVDTRRQLHRCPELCFDLHKTSAIVRSKLDEIGVSYRFPIAKTGLVATIGSGAPCIALRADMDALEIAEETDVPFRSEHPGKMHACGHDCHTAMLLGAARILKQHESELKGTIKLIFQPAEEGGGGASFMVREGVLENPRVDRIFGIHVWPMVSTGTICGRVGTFLAAVDTFRLIIRGAESHAAFPHQSHDPIVASAQIITALQTIVSRETDPLSSAVVSITKIHAGTAFNIIPREVEIAGTIRALNPEDDKEQMKRIKESIDRIAKGIASAMRCSVSMESASDGLEYPATSNDETCWDTAQQVGAELIGPENVLTVKPVMGAEDFSFYSSEGKVPGCFIGLGIRNEAIGATVSVHQSRFKVDEAALPLGTAMHIGFALRSIDELSTGDTA